MNISRLPLRALFSFRPALLWMLVSALLLAGGPGCQTTKVREDGTPMELERKKPKKKNDAFQRKPQEDPMFRAFVTRLRGAVAARDRAALAEMMDTAFVYSSEPTAAGDGPVQAMAFWDANGTWAQVEAVLAEPFTEYQGVMVAPARSQDTTAPYTGHLAGMAFQTGGWKFAYFLNAQ